MALTPRSVPARPPWFTLPAAELALEILIERLGCVRDHVRPNVPVAGLKLDNASRTLRAATQGCGVWETHLAYADVALAMTATSVLQSSITYHITVTNSGLDTASG